MEKYCAQIDFSGCVTMVIVCDDVSWAKSRIGGEWILCNEWLPAIGDTRQSIIDVIGDNV